MATHGKHTTIKCIIILDIVYRWNLLQHFIQYEYDEYVSMLVIIHKHLPTILVFQVKQSVLCVCLSGD